MKLLVDMNLSPRWIAVLTVEAVRAHSPLRGAAVRAEAVEWLRRAGLIDIVISPRATRSIEWPSSPYATSKRT